MKGSRAPDNAATIGDKKSKVCVPVPCRFYSRCTSRFDGIRNLVAKCNAVNRRKAPGRRATDQANAV